MFYKGLFFISKELQLIQRITISKAVLYISENYNQQSLSLPFSTSYKVTIGQPQSRKKPKEREKEKKGEREKG